MTTVSTSLLSGKRFRLQCLFLIQFLLLSLNTEAAVRLKLLQDLDYASSTGEDHLSARFVLAELLQDRRVSHNSLSFKDEIEH